MCEFANTKSVYSVIVYQTDLSFKFFHDALQSGNKKVQVQVVQVK